MTPGLTLLGRGAEYIDVAAKRNWGQRPLNSIRANPAAVRPILARVRGFASMGISEMEPLPTGMAQSWLTVAAVVLSELFTLMFIGGIARVLRCKGRGPARRAIAPAPRSYIGQGSARGEVVSFRPGNEPFTVGGQ